MPEIARGEFSKGYSGDEVLIIRKHLLRLGYQLLDSTSPDFDAELERTLKQFQQDQGLRVDGICGPQTWSRILESGHVLGDRILYRRTPMIRGDDVALLQDTLNKLGFLAGRVDGIFGDDTLAAVKNFQEHAGLNPDGIVGAKTLKTLNQLTPKKLNLTSVAQVQEDIASENTAKSIRLITLSELTSCGTFLLELLNHLKQAGLDSTMLGLGDQAKLAQQANDLQCDLALAFNVKTGAGAATLYYYRGYNYESTRAKHLALVAAPRLREVNGTQFCIEGKSFPFLRETKMTALVIEFPSQDFVSSLSSRTTACIAESIIEWLKPKQKVDSLDSTS
jgi:N-acetylmuramoyl-L-alanine amidase